VPVLVVRDEMAPRSSRLEAVQPTFVVALDGSELAEAALPLACTLEGKLVLVGVVPRPGDLVAGHSSVITYVGEQHAQLVEDALEYLSGVAQRLRGNGLTVDSAVRLGEAAAEIAAAADDYEAAAVMLATHGRTGLARALVGSVAGQVVSHCGVPVLLVPPRSVRRVEEPTATRTGWEKPPPQAWPHPTPGRMLATELRGDV
jgi:nucleotide-binding universal stress UspA family protein